jgi:hypothetical protein
MQELSVPIWQEVQFSIRAVIFAKIVRDKEHKRFGLPFDVNAFVTLMKFHIQ